MSALEPRDRQPLPDEYQNTPDLGWYVEDIGPVHRMVLQLGRVPRWTDSAGGVIAGLLEQQRIAELKGRVSRPEKIWPARIWTNFWRRKDLAKRLKEEEEKNREQLEAARKKAAVERWVVEHTLGTKPSSFTINKCRIYYAPDDPSITYRERIDPNFVYALKHWDPIPHLIVGQEVIEPPGIFISSHVVEIGEKNHVVPRLNLLIAQDNIHGRRYEPWLLLPSQDKIVVCETVQDGQYLKDYLLISLIDSTDEFFQIRHMVEIPPLKRSD